MSYGTYLGKYREREISSGAEFRQAWKDRRTTRGGEARSAGIFHALRANLRRHTAIRYLNFRSFYINNPEYIEDVLVNNARKFHKGPVLQANKGVFGEGLLTSEGNFWLRQRRLAQPAFHRARIAAYAETMVGYTERLLETWRDGEERDIHEEMLRVTLQIVGKTLFDADVARDAQEVGKSLELLLELSADFARDILIPEMAAHAEKYPQSTGDQEIGQNHLPHHRRAAQIGARYRGFAVNAAGGPR